MNLIFARITNQQGITTLTCTAIAQNFACMGLWSGQCDLVAGAGHLILNVFLGFGSTHKATNHCLLSSNLNITYENNPPLWISH